MLLLAVLARFLTFRNWLGHGLLEPRDGLAVTGYKLPGSDLLWSPVAC